MKLFRLSRNDKSLLGSGADHATRLAKSSGIIYLIGGLNIVLGLFALTSQLNLNLGFVIISFVIGFIFFVLGFFTQRRSLIALIIALIIYCLELVLVLFIVFIIALPHFIVSNTVVLCLTVDNLMSKVFLILSSAVIIAISILIPIAMWRGIGAIKELKKETPPTRQK